MAWRRQWEKTGRAGGRQGPGSAGRQGGPAPSPRPWVKTSLQVIKPLSLKQENLRCRGRRGAPGSSGLARAGGPCPAVCSLACCVLCSAVLSILRCLCPLPSPAFLSILSLLPTSPWVPASAPRGACECWGVGGVLPHVHGLPVCFRTEWSVVPCGVHQGH